MARKQKSEKPSSTQAPAPAKGGAPKVPKPAGEKPAPEKPDPTRYGDWEKNGRCIDF